MSRRSRTHTPSTQEGTPPGPIPKAGDMTVTMRGDPDTVREKMNLNQKEDLREETADQDLEVIAALSKPGLKFHVKRILPKEWKGQDARVVVYEDSTPMLYQDITEEVETHSGGKKYRLIISDPENGKPVAAKTFTIDADPILKAPVVQDDSEMLRLMNGEADDNAMEAVGKSVERQVKLMEQRVTLEQFQETLDVLKRKRDNGKGSPSDDAIVSKIASMERQLEQERHTRELERVRTESEQRIRELSLKIAQPHQNDQIAKLLVQMAEDRKDSARRFEAMMAQQREDKANEILRELRASRASGGAGSFKEQMELFGTVAKMFGMRVPGAGGDDEDEDEDDDRPWYERLGTTIADKFLPKLLDKFDGMEKEGKTVTKKEFMAEMNAMAEAAADEASAKQIQKIEEERRRGLPAPAKNPASPAPTTVTELPPEAPPSVAPNPKAPEPATQVAPGTPITIEQESVLHVNGVLMLIQRELQLRRQYYQWNYEGAWENLPEDILEKVCTAEDCISMFDAFKITGINAADIDELKKKISENTKMVVWLKRGHDELKGWWVEKQKDPTFDPGGDDEEEEEVAPDANPEQ
jgi:hypothetical protein